jgi:alpha/beta superfamily hydrolase
MAAAVLLHPHPDMGGNQYNNVVTALYQRLPAAGVTPHRFDFASSDSGVARMQTIEAIEAAAEPVFLVGYSFGGGVAATINHAAVVAWCLIAPALTSIESTIGSDPRPKQVIAAERDQWLNPDALEAATADWIATSHATVASADHFFGGYGAARAADLVGEWIEARLALASS